jgi:uncharacterized membrane protein
MLLASASSTWPIQLEYFPGWVALLWFLALGAPILWLGMRSLAGLGPIRKWVAIGLRLMVLLLILLILGGIRLNRKANDLEVIILRDISQSTSNVVKYPGQSLQGSIDDWMVDAARTHKPPNDRIGVISFQENALIDSIPDLRLDMETHAIRDPGNGTDIAAAIQLALATFRSDAMHRIVLVSDGNATRGDTSNAIAAAAAQGVPIDVMPLQYDIQHEVMMDKFVAPSWKRENEPFGLDIILKSTNSEPVAGKLTVLHQGVPMNLNPDGPGSQTEMAVTLQPGLNPIHIKVPPLTNAGVHTFHAEFEPTGPNAASEDTLAGNNSADAFTYVRGKGQILYVDNVDEHGGDLLADALNQEQIEITPANHIKPIEFPTSLMELQNYDAIILANVPRGVGGLSEDQQANLAAYVHDMGGGLVMIGGPETFGAGGWQGSKLEEVLPVTMDIPAQRQIPKGALVLAMDSAEAPDGNYWGEQCAIKAMETLSAQDEVGVITYGWNTGGRCQWDLPLSKKGDGSSFVSAVKNWGLGDLPSFEQAINLALDGDGTSKGLLASDASQKHIIVITDDDPQMPTRETIDRCIKAKITVSTITVFPHMPGNIAPGTRELAKLTGGRSFGPIESNPSQLPQIFIKEARVVRRTLIQENRDGMPVHMVPSSSELVKGLTSVPPVFGMVLTQRKNNPQVDIPMVIGANRDPLLAQWHTGLGRAVVFTSDANCKPGEALNQWGSAWGSSPMYSKFWAQVVRAVARPPMKGDFNIDISQQNEKAHIVVEGLGEGGSFRSFLNIHGKVAGPDSRQAPMDVQLKETGPGRYEANFDAETPGTYVAGLEYQSPEGDNGMLLGGLSVNSSAEMRDLHSNDALLNEITERTRARPPLMPFDSLGADLFTREGLTPVFAPLPIWESLIPFLLGLILLDIATRRIAWDWTAIRSYAAASAAGIRARTMTRQIETRDSLDALKRIREDGSAATNGNAVAPAVAAVRPDPRAKFEAKGVEGDITKVVGGASDKPIPAARKAPDQPKGLQTGGGMSSLMEAKRRAQQMMKDRENE